MTIGMKPFVVLAALACSITKAATITCPSFYDTGKDADGNDIGCAGCTCQPHDVINYVWRIVM